MYKNGKNHPQVACSFCGKPAEQVTKLITGAGVHICNECVTMCHNILDLRKLLNVLFKLFIKNTAIRHHNH